MREALRADREDAAECTRCHALDLLHVHPDGRRAKPLFHLTGTCSSGVLIVLEAPNFDDTYDEDKQRITCDPETDPSGRFMVELLEHVGLREEDVLLTNSVLCLPAGSRGKHPVTGKLRSACRPWLVRLIEDADPKVVCTMRAAALAAVGRIERHRLKLLDAAGRLHPWFGRELLPLYHPGRLGRVTRSTEQQMKDIEAFGPRAAPERRTSLDLTGPASTGSLVMRRQGGHGIGVLAGTGREPPH